MLTPIHTRVAGGLTFTSLPFLNRFAINKQDLVQLRTLNARNGRTPSTIPRLRMFESSGHYALAVLREWSITCSKYFAFDHFCRSSLLKVERSMSKVLSALSAGCDSALSRNGWDALNLVQLDEPMWRPSLKHQLLLKPLLIARTPLSGIQITVIFFSKKVLVLLCQAICPRCWQADGTPHATTCSQPRLGLTRGSRLTNWQVIPNSLVPSQSTIVISSITTRPELRYLLSDNSLADGARESSSCGEIPDVVRPSTPTCAIPQSLTLCPLGALEELGLTDMILESTPWWSSTSGMADVAVSPSSSNGPIPPHCT